MVHWLISSSIAGGWFADVVIGSAAAEAVAITELDHLQKGFCFSSRVRLHLGRLAGSTRHCGGRCLPPRFLNRWNRPPTALSDGCYFLLTQEPAFRWRGYMALLSMITVHAPQLQTPHPYWCRRDPVITQGPKSSGISASHSWRGSSLLLMLRLNRGIAVGVVQNECMQENYGNKLIAGEGMVPIYLTGRLFRSPPDLSLRSQPAACRQKISPSFRKDMRFIP